MQVGGICLSLIPSPPRLINDKHFFLQFAFFRSQPYLIRFRSTLSLRGIVEGTEKNKLKAN